MSTIYAERSWIQPVLSANGTLGGSSFAVSSSSFLTDSVTGCGDIYSAFDSSTDTYWRSNTGIQYFIMYFPVPVKVSAIHIRSQMQSTRTDEYGSIATGKVYGSNDNSTWVSLYTINNSIRGAYSLNVNSSTFYNYYKVEADTLLSDSYFQVSTVKIVATYQDTDTISISSDEGTVTASNMNEIIDSINKSNTLSNQSITVPPNIIVGNKAYLSDLTGIHSAINNLEELFSLNCCQQANNDCCQSCQEATCQSCQTTTCQSCQATTCQKCQSNCYGGGGSCFIAGSYVLMSDLSLKPIEKIIIGDRIIGANGINTITNLHHSILGNKRSIYTFEDKSLYFSGEHQMWVKKNNKEYFGVVDWVQHIREKDELRYPKFKGRTLSVDPFLIDDKVEFATINGWKLDEPIMDRSFDDNTDIYGLFADGSHTMIVNGYLVAAFPDEKDFDYSTIHWNGLFGK